LALPDGHHAIPQAAKLLNLALVAGHVPPKLFCPETAVVLRGGACPASSMPVPETAVDEHGTLCPWSVDVGGAWQVFGVGLKLMPLPPQDGPYRQLWGRPLLSHPCHES
jgi:hypothetical protein